ncbi:MAG: DUF5615 family PIN-like protein, partial [Chloroflexota bacterium]|nr:DUF5615 family PIN-like protein [Chloroflexota bacterium]
DAGHEAAHVGQEFPGIKDPPLLGRIHSHGWILLTFDTEFHDWIYRDRLPAPLGLVHFSLPNDHGKREPGELLLRLLGAGVQLEGHFTIVTRRGYTQEQLP